MEERSIALLEAATLVARISAEHLKSWRLAVAEHDDVDTARQEAVLFALHRCLEGLYELDHE